IRIDVHCLEHAEGEQLGRATRRSRRDSLTLEILDLLDARALDGYHVHVVRVDDRDSFERQLARKLALAVDRIPCGVDHRESDVRAARADELKVIDGATCDFGRRRHTFQLMRDDVTETAAVWVVNANGAPSCDRQLR